MQLKPLKNVLNDFLYFLHFLLLYSERKARLFGIRFELVKGVFIQAFLVKRGRYKRPFLHVGMISILGIGITLAPFLATTYPLISAASDFSEAQSPSEIPLSITDTEGVFQTHVSPKPRDAIIVYKVEKGDTVSSIAQKFGISADTVSWINNLTSDTITPGDELKILPVTGMAHKVSKGDTVYTIAKRYDTDSQKIINFPFNDFSDPETFTLTDGQTLIVPDGVKPAAPIRSPRPTPVFIPSTLAAGSAGFIWPTSGNITQYPVWYHNAVDIANKEAPPVGAAKKGKIKTSGCDRGGYGCHLIIEHDDGLETLYGHLQRLDVSEGQEVAQGETIGKMGSTGRSTGTHLHFEVRKHGAVVNPLPFLK